MKNADSFPSLATLANIIKQGSGISGTHVRDRTAPISAGEFPDLCKLIDEDLTTCATIPSEGGLGRQGKSESLIKTLNIAASQITLVIEA